MEPTEIPRDPGSRRLARTAFVLLFGLMAINYMDRQVVVPMFAPLKAAWDLSDAKLGLLVSVVSFSVALGAVPLSMLADRWGRVRSIVAMALLWSLATIAGALATSYGALLGMRAAVGLAEAAYGAAGVALLSTLYPEHRRAAVFGAFFVASILGTFLGVAAGGVLVSQWGWRGTFVAVGIPGVAFALAFMVAMRAQRQARVALRASVPVVRRPAEMIAAVLRPRTLVIAGIGSGLQLLPVSMIYAWLPTYLVREYGFGAREAGLAAGAFVLASGAGMIAWGALADRVARTRPCGRLEVPLVGALLTWACFTAAFAALSPGIAQFALLLVGAAVMMASVGPTSAVAMAVVPKDVRATAAAVLAVVQNLLGLAGGPLLAGALSDRYGLSAALAIVPLASLPAAWCYWHARRSYAGDTQRAAAQSSSAPGNAADT